MTNLLGLFLLVFLSGVIWMPIVGWFIGKYIFMTTLELQYVKPNLGGIIGAIIGLVIWLVFVLPKFLHMGPIS